MAHSSHAPSNAHRMCVVPSRCIVVGYVSRKKNQTNVVYTHRRLQRDCVNPMADVRILFFRRTLIHFFGRKKLTKKFLSWPKMFPIFYITSYSCMQCLNIYNYIRFYVVFLTPSFKKAIRDGKVVFYSPGSRDTVCVCGFSLFFDGPCPLDGWRWT